VVIKLKIWITVSDLGPEPKLYYLKLRLRLRSPGRNVYECGESDQFTVIIDYFKGSPSDIYIQELKLLITLAWVPVRHRYLPML
jgi:hypothetical protein